VNKNDIDKSFVSPYDKFLAEFDASHQKTESQIKEINKHQSIFSKRDAADNSEESVIWEGF
jgi:hypothetical protein